MSFQSEKDKQRLIQAAKLFFLHIKDLVSFINKFVELFNLKMKTQIRPMDLNEDSYIKDFFEQMVKNFKEMQAMVDKKHKQMQKESLCFNMVTAVEKCATVSPHNTAKEMFKNIQTPVIASVLRSPLLGSLETSLSLLIKFPIMGLRLSDLYREETKKQRGAATTEKSTSPESPQIMPEDALRKLRDALRTEDVDKPLKTAADELEQFVKTMEPTLEFLKKAIKIMEGDICPFGEAGAK
ncbi:uncharacterized protein C12orf60 homolog [Cricetulus griseus]|uniref:Uncharacterized protein C12orf60 homolog n=1 Tax=Cricetulus griseus TaxID=10029 RepID=A0A061HZZ1_CRIGR|nr:uncharacterized protein C12orf60 homolog [Cricetulus griseus]ERE66415.1 hypothetical protein H671_8g19452 [Cricetulus griseus]